MFKQLILHKIIIIENCIIKTGQNYSPIRPGRAVASSDALVSIIQRMIDMLQMGKDTLQIHETTYW